jgi:hypothetical protein
MGVPDTTTFTLQNVVDEIDNDDNLVGCFNDAIASYFDSNYGPGDESNLLQFRNYGSQNALTSFSGSSGQNDFKFLCGQTTGTSYWHNGSTSTPVVGDIVYTNATGTTAFTSGTWMLTNYPGGRYLNFNGTGSAGEITGLGFCSPP